MSEVKVSYFYVVACVFSQSMMSSEQKFLPFCSHIVPDISFEYNFCYDCSKHFSVSQETGRLADTEFMLLIKKLPIRWVHQYKMGIK